MKSLTTFCFLLVAVACLYQSHSTLAGTVVEANGQKVDLNELLSDDPAAKKALNGPYGGAIAAIAQQLINKQKANPDMSTEELIASL